MGRLLLLLVAASAIGATTTAINRHESERHRVSQAATTESGSLARQAALSGFAITDREVRRNFGALSKKKGVSLDGSALGTYDAIVTEEGEDTHVRVTGRYGDAAHTVDALFRKTIDFPAAVLAYGTGFKVKAKDDFTISGHVHRPPSAPADGWKGSASSSIAGIAVPVAATEQDIREDLKSDALSRIDGSTQFVRDPIPEWLPLLLAEAENHASAQVVEKFDLNGGQVGSPDAPAIVIATKEGKMKGGARGYGILIVNGKFEMKDSNWEGLIVVRGSDKEKVKLDDSTVYGALMLVGVGSETKGKDDDKDDGDGGLEGGHFDLDIFKPKGADNNGHGNNCDGIDSSNPGKGKGKKGKDSDPSEDDECGPVEMDRDYHKHQYDDSYDVTGIDFFNGPDIGPDFQDFVATHGHKNLRVEFFNDFNGSGTYTIGGFSGTVRDGFSQTFRLDQISQFTLDFESLKELRGSDPGSVSGDDANRDRALSVRFYDGSRLIYEVSAYEHAKEKRDGIATGSGGGSSDGDGDDDDDSESTLNIVGEFEIEFKKQARVLWAPETLTRLVGHVKAIDEVVEIERVLLGDRPSF